VPDGALAFRYDNAPHHRELATRPHHVHIGPLQRVSPADQPTLGQVLRQVESLLKTWRALLTRSGRPVDFLSVSCGSA
jgi:hypothetical protein